MQIISKNLVLLEKLKKVNIISKNSDHYCTLNSYTSSPNYRTNVRRNDRQQTRRSENSHPYRNLYPWNSLSEFVSVLVSNVIYNDGQLIGMYKPWGVGIHKAEQTITSKNAQLLQNVYCGSPKFCMDDTLELLTQQLGLTNRLQIFKTVDRFMSGVVLMSTNEKVEKRVRRSIEIARSDKIPFMKFWCITKGWPVINGPFLEERVGIKMVETDELGDYKEPIIIAADKLTMRMRRKFPMNDGMIVIPVVTDMRMLECNKSISAALVDLNVSNTKSHFIQCYLANKASFVLGDTRFSRRVQNILGVPMSTNKAHVSFDDSFEPLPKQFRDNLMVMGNSHIPLMIHHKSITLPRYNGKETLVIDSPILPNYFAWTLDKLGMRDAIYKNYNTDTVVSKTDISDPYEEYNQSVIKQYDT